MRRRVTRGPGAQNLDSFLDILTNTVGVLIVVLMFVVLSAADASILVRTPLRTDTEKDARIFEVRGDRVIHVEVDQVSESFRQFRNGLPEIDLWNVYHVARRIDNFTTSTENYRVDVVGSVLGGGIGLRYRARSAEVGTPLEEIKSDSVEYLHVLSRLDPEENYVAFLVWPDGIEAFRAARDLATRRGIQSGWEPLSGDDEIIFGSNGRTIGVQ